MFIFSRIIIINPLLFVNLTTKLKISILEQKKMGITKLKKYGKEILVW